MPYFDTALPKPYGTAQVRRVVRLFPTKKKEENYDVLRRTYIWNHPCEFGAKVHTKLKLEICLKGENEQMLQLIYQ